MAEANVTPFAKTATQTTSALAEDLKFVKKVLCDTALHLSSMRYEAKTICQETDDLHTEAWTRMVSNVFVPQLCSRIADAQERLWGSKEADFARVVSKEVLEM